MDQPGQPQLIKFLPQKLSYTFLKKNVFSSPFPRIAHQISSIFSKTNFLNSFEKINNLSIFSYKFYSFAFNNTGLYCLWRFVTFTDPQHI